MNLMILVRVKEEFSSSGKLAKVGWFAPSPLSGGSGHGQRACSCCHWFVSRTEAHEPGPLVGWTLCVCMVYELAPKGDRKSLEALSSRPALTHSKGTYDQPSRQWERARLTPPPWG